MFEKPVDIACPSGLQAQVRALTIAEANILADEQNAHKGRTFDQILSACTKSILDAGPYKLDAAGGLSWPKVLIADRMFALMQIRIATWGDNFPFKIRRCEECRRSFEWDLPLSQLPIKMLPVASREKIAKGENRFTCELPGDGRKVTFQLLTGEMDRNAAKVADDRPGDRVTLALSSRVLEIEEVEAKDKNKFLSALPLQMGMGLVSAMDEQDGGIETVIEVQHTAASCGATFEVEVPFGDRGYWMPKAKAKKD